MRIELLDNLQFDAVFDQFHVFSRSVFEGMHTVATVAETVIMRNFVLFGLSGRMLVKQEIGG